MKSGKCVRGIMREEIFRNLSCMGTLTGNLGTYSKK